MFKLKDLVIVSLALILVSPVARSEANVNQSVESVSIYEGGASGHANLKLAAGSETPAGTYPVTLIANSGDLTHTITASDMVDTSVQISASNLRFGNQLVKTASAPQTVTLTNGASVPLAITSFSFVGANPWDFSQTNNCGPSLPRNSSCTVTVTFTPGSTGSRSATLNVNDSDATSPQQVTLTGTGTQPAASVSPGSIRYANQIVGTTSGPQTVVLTNTGTATLNITKIATTGTASSDFKETNTCASSLAPSAKCTISVTLTPRQANTRSANLTITDSATPGTQTVSLSGTGIQPLAQPLAPVTYGATVNENLETAFIYVDAANGNNGNPGTMNLPLQTIGAAISMAETNNQNNVGSRIIINPGTYRESDTVSPPNNATSMPITIEAAINGTAYVSGAQQYTGWQAYGGNSNIYTKAWTNNWGLCNTLAAGAPPAPDIVLRQEMVFVNGGALTQVLSLNEMTPGTFYVNNAGGTIYMSPPAGTNVSTADVEVATLPTLMQIQGQSNLVVRGLTFEYANSCRENAAVTVSSYNGSSNVLFDTDDFLWNNSQGLSISSTVSNFTVQNSIANHNGEAGFQITKVASGLFQSDQSSYNNWRGAQGAYYSWNSAGTHFYQMHYLTLNNFTSSYNQTHALHFDTDNATININSMSTYGDLLSSIMAEKDEGPITISSTSLCSSSALEGYSGEVGLTIRDSENVSFTGSGLVNNNFDLAVTGVPGGFAETNWQTGQNYQLVNTNLTFENNVVDGVSGQNVFNDPSLNGTDWTEFQSTLSSNDNTWWDASNSTAFTVPVPNQGTVEGFSGWQSTTGQDQQSVWQQPTGNPGAACSSAVDANDFWFIIPNASSSLTISPQTSAVFAATMVPLGTFNGTAQLSFDGIQNIPGGAIGIWSASTVGPNQTVNFTVTPGPTTPSGTYPVVMIANSGNITRTITALLVVDTTVKLSTTAINFGNQLINTTSSNQQVVVTNTGSTPLAISNVTFSNGNPNAWGENDNCTGVDLPSNSSCTITVNFSPNYTGSQTITVNVNDSDATSPQQVALSGTGTQPAVSLSPSTYTFANQVVGTTSAPQQITLTNTGTGPLTITSITVGGGNAGDFAETNNCGSSVAAGASCTISVTFDPGNPGNRSGNVTVAGNSSPANTVLTLNGTGIQAGASFSAGSLAFGTQVWNTTSAPQTLTLTNTGTAVLNISSVAITGANPSDYAQTNNCGSSVAAGASCSINVTFTPNVLGSTPATLAVTDNAPSGTQTATLNGNGITSVSFSPKSVGFGSHKVGTTSNPATVTVTNLGNALSIQSIRITGTNAGDFSETNTCGSVLAPNASCTVSVTFSPQATGSRSATLNLNDSDPASPQQITLTGTGA